MSTFDGVGACWIYLGMYVHSYGAEQFFSSITRVLRNKTVRAEILPTRLPSIAVSVGLCRTHSRHLMYSTGVQIRERSYLCVNSNSLCERGLIVNIPLCQ